MVRPRTKRGKALRPPQSVKSLVSCGLSRLPAAAATPNPGLGGPHCQPGIGRCQRGEKRQTQAGNFPTAKVQPENREPPARQRFPGGPFPLRAGQGNYGRLTGDAAAVTPGPETRPIPRAFYHQELRKDPSGVDRLPDRRRVIFRPKGRIRPAKSCRGPAG